MPLHQLTPPAAGSLPPAWDPRLQPNHSPAATHPLQHLVQAQMLPPLHAAAHIGNLAVVRQLLAAGADPHAIAPAGAPAGATALHFAAMAPGRQAVIAALLEAGAAPNSRAVPAGDCPLHLAARENHAGNVRQLLAAGALHDARMAGGITPLFQAARQGAAEAAAALLAAGAGEVM